MRLRLILSTFIAALAVIPSGSTVERRLAIMGTSLRISVTARSRVEALSASEAAVRETERLDALLSTWRSDSPLTALNQAPAGARRPVPRELLTLLRTVWGWGARTDGAFEPAILPLVTAWGLRTGGRVPAAEEWSAALSATGRSRFRFDADSSTVTRLHAAAGIDEGAWGKGYALDRAAKILRGRGVVSALLDFGGQILSLPASPSDAIPIGLADPRDRSRLVGQVLLGGGSLSTSGDSERTQTAGGVRIGHLLDPHSGRPAADFGSVTVLAPSGLVADILSTAFFVLGPDRGPRLSHRLRDGGIAHDVLYLVERKSGLEARASAGFVRRLADLEIPLLPLEEAAAPVDEAGDGNEPDGGKTP